MRHASGRDLFHIHLLIHAHCISICFPPITSITQSQSLSPHIPHLSLSSLSSINLNMWSPTGHSQGTHQLQRKGACSLLVVCRCSLVSLLLRAGKEASEEIDPSSTPGPDNGVSLPQGSLGE